MYCGNDIRNKYFINNLFAPQLLKPDLLSFDTNNLGKDLLCVIGLLEMTIGHFNVKVLIYFIL